MQCRLLGAIEKIIANRSAASSITRARARYFLRHHIHITTNAEGEAAQLIDGGNGAGINHGM